MSEWAPVAAGGVLLLVGAAAWVRASVLLDRVEQERRRLAQDRLAALDEIRLTLDRWGRR